MSKAQREKSDQKLRKGDASLPRRLSYRRVNAKRDLTLLCIALPAMLMIILFSYMPMTGLILAFKKFSVAKGIWGSDWVGLKNFNFFFKSSDAWTVLRNTIGLNCVFIFLTLVVSVCLALMINEIKSRTSIKLVQTILFLPYFLSWVVVSYMLYAFLNHNYGIVNTALAALGLSPISWYSNSKYWPYILSFMYIWKNAGYYAVIYYASIMGIDDSLFEAAALDGASHRQSIWHITLPLLKQIILCMTILQVGKIMYSDFGLFYQLPRDMGALYATTDVIDTYVYRMLRVTGNIGVSAAVGFFQAVVGFFLVIGSNAIVRKIDKDSAIF